MSVYCVACLKTEIQLPSEYRFPPIVRSKYTFRDPSGSIGLTLITKDNYVDAYLRVIKNADPLRTSLVFSCGMGAVRTTFAMASACVVRRRQLMLRGQPDPYATRLTVTSPLSNLASGDNSVRLRTHATTHSSDFRNLLSFSPADLRYVSPRFYQHWVILTPLQTPQTPPQSLLGEAKVRQALEQANAQQDLNRSLLRLTHILQQTLPSGSSHRVIDLLLTNSVLLDDLRKAHMGNYGMILSLLGCLDDGLKAKKLVDKVIDSCACLIHKFSVCALIEDKCR